MKRYAAVVAVVAVVAMSIVVIPDDVPLAVEG